MKIKIALVIVALVAVGLGIGLIKTNQDATKLHDADTLSLTGFSNQLVHTTDELEHEKQRGLQLQSDMSNRVTEISALSNNLAQVNDNLSAKEAALKAALEETQKRDIQIADLEKTNQDLDKRAVDLQGNINTLQTQIAETQKKLDASEGDKAFLEKELQRLQAEKAEMERKFNDIAVLKAQVRKLKTDLDEARRLEWTRMGVFAAAEQKGAQKLMQGATSVPAKPASGTNTYDLNVEVKSDGSVKVIPPITNTADPASNK